jgi:hypothetical protein
MFKTLSGGVVGTNQRAQTRHDFRAKWKPSVATHPTPPRPNPTQPNPTHTPLLPERAVSEVCCAA